MKRLLIICILVALQMTVGVLSFHSKEVRASYYIPLTKTYKISSSSYDKINISSFAKVRIVEGRGDVVVRINSALEPHLLVEVYAGELIVELDHYIDSREKFVFEVLISYNHDLAEISASGFVTVESEVVLTGKDVNITASGGASIEAITKGRLCSVDASGASKVDIECRSETLKIKTSGAADVKVDIDSQRCGAMTFGASDITFKGKVNQIRLELNESSDISLRALSYETIYVDNTSDGRLIYPKKIENRIRY